jgi:hypothetical protein
MSKTHQDVADALGELVDAGLEVFHDNSNVQQIGRDSTDARGDLRSSLRRYGDERCAGGGLMCEARRFGEAVAAATAQRPRLRRALSDAVARRDVERTHTIASAEDGADDLVLVEEGGTAAGGVGERPGLFAEQPGLGATDGGHVEEESEVAGEAEAPRVGVTLAIDEEEVDGPAEAREGLA